MPNDSHITVQYKTPKGSVWPTLNEAIIAHRIEIADNVYLQSYQMEAVVRAVVTPCNEEEIK